VGLGYKSPLRHDVLEPRRQAPTRALWGTVQIHLPACQAPPEQRRGHRLQGGSDARRTELLAHDSYGIVVRCEREQIARSVSAERQIWRVIAERNHARDETDYPPGRTLLATRPVLYSSTRTTSVSGMTPSCIIASAAASVCMAAVKASRSGTSATIAT
jgi:hypothetical protein